MKDALKLFIESMICIYNIDYEFMLIHLSNKFMIQNRLFKLHKKVLKSINILNLKIFTNI